MVNLRTLSVLLTVGLATGIACQAQANPLALVQRAAALHEANARRERSLAFRERVVTKDLDSDGNVRRSQQKVHDVLLIDGSPQRILLEEDGAPQSPEQVSASQDFLRRVIDIRNTETEAERRRRVEEYQRKRQEYHDAVAEIPLAFDFALEGEERCHGRICYKLRATPREGYQPRNRYGRIFTQTVGVIWIDKTTGEWLRAEGELRETINLGWIFVQVRKGTKAIAEQRPFPGHGWLMSSLWYRSVARIGLFMYYRREQHGDYWAYQQMSPAHLARALETGYPSGSMHPEWLNTH